MGRLKATCGVIFMGMAMGELATSFIAFPSIVVYTESMTEWWAEYLPVTLLLNSVLASVLLTYAGIKMVKNNNILTKVQTDRMERWLYRWGEKKKYGYNKSDYIIGK